MPLSSLYIWVITGILLIIAEAFIPGFAVIFFGFGALLTALITDLIPGLNTNLYAQILFWLFISISMLFLLRNKLSGIFKGRDYNKTQMNSLIGSDVLVLEPISRDKPGRIKAGGTSWTALSNDAEIEKGNTVKILDISEQSSLCFIVALINLEET